MTRKTVMTNLLLALNRWYLNYMWGFARDAPELVADLAEAYKQWVELDESEDDDGQE